MHAPALVFWGLQESTPPLFLASQEGHHKAVRVLLSAGVDANEPHDFMVGSIRYMVVACALAQILQPRLGLCMHAHKNTHGIQGII